MTMELFDHMRNLKAEAVHLRDTDTKSIYAAIGDDDVPEEAREKLYGIDNDIEELAERLSEAASIIEKETKP